MDSIPAFVPEGDAKKPPVPHHVVTFAGQDIERRMTAEMTQDVVATPPMFAAPTSDPAHLTSGELQHLRQLHDDAVQNKLQREMIIGGSCGVVSTLLVGVENAFKVNMPGVTRIVVLFHLSCVMMVISFVAGSLAGTFNIIRSGPEVSELLFVVYLSYVSHISLARQVRREHKWVILLVRIVANIVCAMVLESAFVDPDLLDPVQCLAAVMVVFAGALTTLHLLVEGQENSPLVASHRFLQLFA
ncbi:uncharacterized protein LOC142803784 isoform X3 [Rhipicephalus microplus]|uniref:uncharacterized protein LOC142803784 isoform X3 n=1 Tax=Rhipicephalus microplus TaxID=6941 RepID=UPI003F6D916D